MRGWAMLGVLIGACTLEPPRPVTLVEGLPPTENVVELKGVAIDRFERDHLRARAALSEAHVDRGAGTIDGSQVEIAVIDEEGNTTASARAPRGKADRQGAVLEGGVEVRDRDARTMRSETMRYDAASDTVIAPGKVIIEGENFHAEGTSMVIARGAGTIAVAGPVTATVSDQRPRDSRGSR